MNPHLSCLLFILATFSLANIVPKRQDTIIRHAATKFASKFLLLSSGLGLALTNQSPQAIAEESKLLIDSQNRYALTVPDSFFVMKTNQPKL